MVEYPEHEKMVKIHEESQRLGEFIDWLRSEGIVLCMTSDKEIGAEIPYFPISESIERILARYFSIDLNKIENEKRAMLESIRAANKKTQQNKEAASQ